MASPAPIIRNSAKALVLRGRSILLQECVFGGRTVYLLPGGTQEFVARNHLVVDGHGEHVVECIYRCVPESDDVPRTGELPDLAQVGVRCLPLDTLPGLTMWPETGRSLLVAWDRGDADLGPGYLGDCP